jgi:hypothetical protein
VDMLNKKKICDRGRKTLYGELLWRINYYGEKPFMKVMKMLFDRFGEKIDCHRSIKYGCNDWPPICHFIEKYGEGIENV